jgi:FMN hydrolase / 5-amino-6-(5-phospho-D-ribitylamino)uracil phosphatase
VTFARQGKVKLKAMPWISFDLDGTICDWPFNKAVFIPMRAHLNPFVLESMRQEYFSRLGSSDPVNAFDWDGIHDLTATQYGLPAFEQILEFAAKVEFHPELVYPDTQPALEKLRAKGWKIACGTNGYAKYQGYALTRLGVQADAFIAPDTVNACKPQAEFLKRLPELTGDKTALEGLIHVGDLLTQDVLAANRAGAKAVWVWREMPEFMREIPVLERTKNKSVQAAILEQTAHEFTHNGKLGTDYSDLPPKPDFVVADLLELVHALESESTASSNQNRFSTV